MATVPTLKLVCESKICDLLPCDPPTKRWEASGVLVKDGHYFVVFDDRTEIARVSDDLQPNRRERTVRNGPRGLRLRRHHLQRRQATVLLVGRITRQASGHYQATIVEYDDEFRLSQGSAGRLHLREQQQGL